jgi:hypothetical protein
LGGGAAIPDHRTRTARQVSKPDTSVAADLNDEIPHL